MYKQRRETIRSIINSQPFTSFKELEAKFPDISSMTIRRDVEYFQNKGEVVKVRGGARSVKFMMTSMDETFDKRRAENVLEKHMIAHSAVELLEPGKNIFLDSGTTILTMATLIPDKRFNITTNCPYIALELLKNPKLIINVIGGTLNRTDLSISGVQANRYIDASTFDIAFIAPTGFSEYSGFTTGNWAESEVKKHIIKNSQKVVALLDTSKFNKSMPYTFADIKDISVVVCDSTPPKRILEIFKENGVELIIANEVKNI